MTNRKKDSSIKWLKWPQADFIIIDPSGRKVEGLRYRGFHSRTGYKTRMDAFRRVQELNRQADKKGVHADLWVVWRLGDDIRFKPKEIPNGYILVGHKADPIGCSESLGTSNVFYFEEGKWLS